MKILLKRLSDLDVEHDKTMGEYDMSIPSERQKYYILGGTIVRQKMAIEATVNLIRARLVALVCAALDEAKELLEGGEMQQAKNLLESTGRVASNVFAQEGPSWEELRSHFSSYQRQYMGKSVRLASDYCVAIDEIEESARVFLQDYCSQHNVSAPL